MKAKINESTEEHIIKAAYDVMIEKGFSDTKMQDIADRAGINRTVLNYYFRTREKLYQKIASDILHQGMPQMFETLNGDLPLFEKIEVFTEQYINRILENPFMPLFMVSEIYKIDSSFFQSVIDKVNPNIDGFVAHVEKEIALKHILPIHPIQLYMNIMSLCVFPVMAKPLLSMFAGIDEQAMTQLLEDRKKEVAQMIIKLIKSIKKILPKN